MTTALGRVLADWATGRPTVALPLPCGPLAPIAALGLLQYAPNALLPYGMLRDHLAGAGPEQTGSDDHRLLS